MALFTRADDANIPFLTRLVQVDMSDRDEVRRFMWLAHQELSGLMPISTEETKDFVERFGVLGDLPFEEATQQLSFIHGLAKYAMETLVESDNEVIPPGVSNNFAIYAHEHLMTGLCYVNNLGEEKMAAEVEVELPNGMRGVPRQALRRMLVGRRPFAVSEGWEALDALLFDASQKCRRCIECKNPFIVGRANQRFCSNRCRTRYSVKLTRRNHREKNLVVSGIILDKATSLGVR